MSTAIEWTDETWNPVVGCSKVSEGCRNCYAESVAHRFGFTPKPWTAANASENVQCYERRLTQPLHWIKPRRVFVNSMSDLFHEEVPFEFIDKVFTIMLACAIFENRRHTFQILTKRPDRMLEYFKHRTAVEHLKAWAEMGDYWIIMDDPDTMFSEYVAQFVSENRQSEDCRSVEYLPWSKPENLYPLPNLWLGVSVEDQKTADERIPLLLQAPAVVRFLSCEPLLGPVNLKLHESYFYQTTGWQPPIADFTRVGECIHWVIVGGESGPKARPMHPEWARSIRDQCQEARVPFFFKQWGEWHYNKRNAAGNPLYNVKEQSLNDPIYACMFKVGKKNAGRLLDGREWNEMPVVDKTTASGRVECDSKAEALQRAVEIRDSIRERMRGGNPSESGISTRD